jgi:predicted MFS family arabinose efflux permease
VGRKPAVYVGLALFSSGCLLAPAARSFPVMLAAACCRASASAGLAR